MAAARGSARTRHLLAPLVGASLLLLTRAASADLSSWLSVGGGGSLTYDNANSRYGPAGAVSVATGVGASPVPSLVLGGLVRVTTRTGLGTDVGWMVRGTSAGYSRGDWGLGLDVGVSVRSWGHGVYGNIPLQSVVLLGAPLGFALAIGSDIFTIGGDTTARGGFVVLEFDVLRCRATTDRW